LIREATAADIEAVLDLGERFHAYSPWAYLTFDREAVAETVLRMIEAPKKRLIFLSEDGICGGLDKQAYTSLLTTRVAVELFWYAPTGGNRASLRV
jgi:hypothetical protein